MKTTSAKATRCAAFACAIVLSAHCAPGEIFVKDPVPVGGADEYTAAKIHNQGPTSGGIAGFSSTGKWLRDTGVILASASGLSYPEHIINVTAAGGSFEITFNSTNNDPGRTTSRAISAALPTTGALYFSVLMKIDATSMSKLTESYEHYIGLNRSAFSGTGSDKTSQQFPNPGVFVGFSKIDGAVTLALGVNGTAHILVPEVAANETYFCVVKINIDAGADGNEIVTAVVNPTDADMNGMYTVSAEAPVLGAGQTFTHFTLGGAFITNGGKVNFDEFVVANTCYDVCPIDTEGVAIASAAATDVDCFSATANGYLHVFAGSVDVLLDWGLAPDALDTPENLGTFSASSALNTTLSGLMPDTTYHYRHRAVGVPESVTSSVTVAFTTLGAVTLSGSASNVAQTAYVNADVSHFDVAPVTVSLWFGESPDALVLTNTWQSVPATAAPAFEFADCAWGGTYFYAFKAEYTYAGKPYAYWSSTNTVAIPASATWTGAGDGADWNDAANWNIGTVPTEHIATTVNTVANNSVITSSVPANVSKSLTVNAKPVSFDLGEDGTLTTGGISANGANVVLLSGTLTVTNHTYMYWAATTTIEAGATFETGSIQLQYSNTRVTVKDGGHFKTSKDADARDQNNAGYTVLTGGVWEANGITLGQSTSLLIDGGIVTNAGGLVTGGRSGTNLTYKEVEVANNGLYKQTGGNFTIGTWHTTGVLVRDDGVMEVDAMLSVGNTNTGAKEDRLVVSNATLRAGTLRICPDNRYHSNNFFVYEDAGRNTTVDIAGDLQFAISSTTWTTTHGTNNAFRVFGGSVSIGGAFTVGSATGPSSNNVFHVSGSASRVTAASMATRNHTKLRFDLDDGFGETAAVSVTGNVTLTDTTSLTVDTTACNAGGTFTLVESTGGVLDCGIAEENVTFVLGPDHNARLVLRDDAVCVHVSAGRTVLIVR